MVTVLKVQTLVACQKKPTDPDQTASEEAV